MNIPIFLRVNGAAASELVGQVEVPESAIAEGRYGFTRGKLPKSIHDHSKIFRFDFWIDKVGTSLAGTFYFGVVSVPRSEYLTQKEKWRWLSEQEAKNEAMRIWHEEDKKCQQ